MSEIIVRMKSDYIKVKGGEYVQDLVRCKDCKYWGKIGLCEKWDYYISNEDFYCGCAERRTDE